MFELLCSHLRSYSSEFCLLRHPPSGPSRPVLSDNVRSDAGKTHQSGYNIFVTKSRPLPNLERDYSVFLWFLTVTTAGMYAWVVYYNPRLRQPLPFVVFTALL